MTSGSRNDPRSNLYKAAADEVLEQIEKRSRRLDELEQATGVALATSHVDLSSSLHSSPRFISQEQRLMPRYVEEFFKHLSS